MAILLSNNQSFKTNVLRIDACKTCRPYETVKRCNNIFNFHEIHYREVPGVGKRSASAHNHLQSIKLGM